MLWWLYHCFVGRGGRLRVKDFRKVGSRENSSRTYLTENVFTSKNVTCRKPHWNVTSCSLPGLIVCKNILTCTSCLCCTYTVNVTIAGKCQWSERGTGLNTLYFCLLHRNTELVLSVKNTVSVEQCHIGLGALPACRLAHLLRINVPSGRLSSVIKTIYRNTRYTVSAWCWWSTLSEMLPGFWRAASCVATQEPPGNREWNQSKTLYSRLLEPF